MSATIKIQEILPGIEQLWEHSKGSPSIQIAVLDGPVDLNNAALTTANITSLDRPDHQKVRSMHGTFVSSLIFSDHQSGVQGIAPNCLGIVKRIYHEDEGGRLLSCSQSDIQEGVLAAIEAGADIINISGGERLQDGDGIIAPLATALRQCEELGILVIAATGNEGENRIHVPASFPTVLAVGSISQDGSPSVFSNWSKQDEKHGLVAPGEGIVGAVPNSAAEQAVANGTSFSTALVSGVAGLLASIQEQQGMEKDLLAIRQILLDQVIPCDPSGGVDCQRLMNGSLNIPAAVEQLLATVPKLEKQANSSCCETCQQSETPPSEQPETQPSNQSNQNTLIMSNNTESTPSETPVGAVNPHGEVANQSSSNPTTQAPLPPVAVGGNPSSAAVVKPSTSPGSDEPISTEPTVRESATYNPAVNAGDYPTFENADLVNAIGQPSYDFGTQNNLDTFIAYMREWYNSLDRSMKDMFTDSPHDHLSMAAFLLYQDKSGQHPNAFMASQLIWLLNMNATPIFSISPKLSDFRSAIYYTLELFLAHNVGLNVEKYNECTMNPEQDVEGVLMKEKEEDDEMRMVLPGYVSGRSKLLNGSVLESVSPVAYGLSNWTVKALVDRLQLTAEERKNLVSILKRLYVTAWNRGKSPDDRALNYSLYNIIELSEIIKEVTESNQQFSGFKVLPSKITRQKSISREVRLTFFDPTDTNKAATTYAMQVDVSGVTPVIIGETEKWFSPVSVANA